MLNYQRVMVRLDEVASPGKVYVAEEWSSNPMTEPIVQVGKSLGLYNQSSIKSVSLGLVHLLHSFYFSVGSNAWWDEVGSMDDHSNSNGTSWKYGLQIIWLVHWSASPIPIHPHPTWLLQWCQKLSQWSGWAQSLGCRRRHLLALWNVTCWLFGCSAAVFSD